MSTIEKDSVVELHYTVKDHDGETLESSRENGALHYLHGHNNLIPGLENALAGRKAGDTFMVDIVADEAYGQRNETMVHTVDIESFAHIEDLSVGMRLQGQTDQGVVAFMVTDITDGKVTVDANHPLAGMDLKFDVDVVSVREASAEEIEHGHVHGPGGHHH